MIFNSLVFVEFAILFFAIWHFVRQIPHYNHIFLICASCIFYGFAGWWFVPLLIATATIDFTLAKQIERDPARKKTYLWLSLISNLGVLATFKYLGFFGATLQSLCDSIGVPASVPIVNLILPIGISFYTFQSLSYVFDVYSGRIKAAASLLQFLSIVSLFAHLVAGPIVRVADILPQVVKFDRPTPAQVWGGANLIAFGYFKKMVLADTLAPFVDSIYKLDGPSHSPGAYFLAILAFSFQIYFDFSGYTDIARGLAKWVGIEFTLNFNDPYTSVGIRDFWSRWHISLSSWIRDYVYIPLGGSRHGKLRTHINQGVAMVVSGFWHGANWTFVIWGFAHAALTSFERLTDWPKKLSLNLATKLLAMTLTFTAVTLTWIFFRASTLDHALFIFQQLPSAGDGLILVIKENKPVFYVLVFAVSYELIRFLRRESKIAFPETPRLVEAIRIGFILFAIAYFRGPGQAFIYFQF